VRLADVHRRRPDVVVVHDDALDLDRWHLSRRRWCSRWVVSGLRDDGSQTQTDGVRRR
jgi:hypothetical protein